MSAFARGRVAAGLAGAAAITGLLSALLDDRSGALADVSWTLAGLVAVLGTAAARRCAPVAERRAWSYLVAASVCWLLGQLAWIAQSLAGSWGSPTLADAGWLAFPILATAGTYRLVPLSRDTVRIARLEMLPLLVAVGTVMWAFLHGAVEASELPLAAKVTTFAYPVLYLALPLVLLQAFIGWRVRPNGALLLVLAGLVAEAAGFALWAPALLDGSYAAGASALDLLWTAGMLAVGLGGLRHGGASAQRGGEPRWGGLLPSLTFLAVLATLAFSAVAERGLSVQLPLRIGLLAIGGALMARGVALDRRHRRLLADQRAAHEALRRARVTSARYFELSRDLLCTATLDGRLVDVNPAWEATLGFPLDELRDRPLVDLIHPGDRERTLAELEGLAVETPTADHFANRYLTRDGDVRWLSWSSQLDREEGLVYARGKDVTDRRLAEAERQAAAAELERSNSELEQFAYAASHDLAEPLRSITGFSQFLQAEYGDRLDDEGLEYLDHVIAGAHRMRSLIDALLDYSRIGRARPALARVPVDDVLDDALDSLHAAIAETGTAIDRGELPVVQADRGELARVFQNLIANAIKFTDGEPPRIRIGAERDGDLWRVSVDDDGIGIEPAYAERVFGMFKRLNDRERYAGAGIGLAVAKRIVERHGGRMWVEPGPVRGSSFKFTLKHASEARR